MRIPHNIKIRVHESAHKKFESRRSATRKKVEGTGAGYTVTIMDMEITEEPKIEYSTHTGSFVVTAPVEYGADAAGRNWSSGSSWSVSGLNAELGVEPDPCRGDLTFKIRDSPKIWKYVDPVYFEDEDKPTWDEKIEALQGYFYKGRTFSDFSEYYGVSVFHTDYVGSVGVYFPSDALANRFDLDLEFEERPRRDTGNYDDRIDGTLTIDSAFLQDIGAAHRTTLQDAVIAPDDPEDDDDDDDDDDDEFRYWWEKSP